VCFFIRFGRGCFGLQTRSRPMQSGSSWPKCSRSLLCGPALTTANPASCATVSPSRLLPFRLDDLFDVPPERRSHHRHPTKLFLQIKSYRDARRTSGRRCGSHAGINQNLSYRKRGAPFHLAGNGPHVFGVRLDMSKRGQGRGITALRTDNAVATFRIRALADILPVSPQQ